MQKIKYAFGMQFCGSSCLKSYCKNAVAAIYFEEAVTNGARSLLAIKCQRPIAQQVCELHFILCVSWELVNAHAHTCTLMSTFLVLPLARWSPP